MAATPRTSRIASTRLNRFTSPPLERGLVTFARADPNRGFDRKDEDLAVTDVAGLRRADAGERFLDVVELERLDDRLDLFHRWSSESPRSNARAERRPTRGVGKS